MLHAPSIVTHMHTHLHCTSSTAHHMSHSRVPSASLPHPAPCISRAQCRLLIPTRSTLYSAGVPLDFIFPSSLQICCAARNVTLPCLLPMFVLASSSTLKTVSKACQSAAGSDRPQCMRMRAQQGDLSFRHQAKQAHDKLDGCVEESKRRCTVVSFEHVCVRV